MGLSMIGFTVANVLINLTLVFGENLLDSIKTAKLRYARWQNRKAAKYRQPLVEVVEKPIVAGSFF